MFYFLEDEDLLDPLNENHIAALHYTYMNDINEKLHIWQRAWANHQMRSTKTSPLRLWIAGQQQNPIGINIPIPNLNEYGVDGDIAITNDDEQESRPIFPPPALHLSEACINELNQVPPEPANYKIDKYIQNCQIINRYYGYQQ